MVLNNIDSVFEFLYLFVLFLKDYIIHAYNIINQDNFILFLEDLKLEMSELIIEKSGKLDFTVFFKNV